MKDYTFLDLAVDVLKQSQVPMSIIEIWTKACEMGINEKIGSLGKTPEKTLSARMYCDIRDNANSAFIQVEKRPAKFLLKGISIASQESEPLDEVEKKEKKEKKEKSNYNERDLHVLLSSFVYSNHDFKCLTKTLFHEKTTKAKKGVNEWLHPDIVGVHFPDEDYPAEIVNLQTQLGYRKHRIYSFEMKKELSFANIRECYFQAVSNSSWANEGYLVTHKILKDDDFLSELRRLNNAFGIGIIVLNPEHITQSEVLFPSKISESLDWDTIDKLMDNPDFSDFIKEITTTTKSNSKKRVYDESYDNDEACREYAENKHII